MDKEMGDVDELNRFVVSRKWSVAYTMKILARLQYAVANGFEKELKKLLEEDIKNVRNAQAE